MPVRLDGLARARRAARLGITPVALKHRERAARERAREHLEAKPWIGERIEPALSSRPESHRPDGIPETRHAR